MSSPSRGHGRRERWIKASCVLLLHLETHLLQVLLKLLVRLRLASRQEAVGRHS